MSDKTNWTDIVLIILGVVFTFFSFRWFFRLLGMSDGKAGFGYKDFKNLISLVFFLWAAIFIIVKEANRDRVEHLFSDMWLAFVFAGLLYVLSMEYVFDKFADILKLLIDLRARTKTTTTETTTTETESQTGKRVPNES